MSFQGEYAAQVLGLTGDTPPQGAVGPGAGGPRDDPPAASPRPASRPASRPLYSADASAPPASSPFRKEEKETNHVNKFINNVSTKYKVSNVSKVLNV